MVPTYAMVVREKSMLISALVLDGFHIGQKEKAGLGKAEGFRNYFCSSRAGAPAPKSSLILENDVQILANTSRTYLPVNARMKVRR